MDPELGRISKKLVDEGVRGQFRFPTKQQPVVPPLHKPLGRTEDPSIPRHEILPSLSSPSVHSSTADPYENTADPDDNAADPSSGPPAEQTEINTQLGSDSRNPRDATLPTVSDNDAPAGIQGSTDGARQQPESSQAMRQLPQTHFPRPPPERGLCFFINVACRGPVSGVSAYGSLPAGVLNRQTSTREDLSLWLNPNGLPIQADYHHSKPLCRIFEIIHADTLDFLLSIETFLDSVLSNSDNEAVLENNIRVWRSLLNITALELRYLTQQIPKPTEFLAEPSHRGHHQDDHPSKMSSQQQLVREVSRVQERLDKTLITLVSSLSVVESRRAIVEAESVSKLTELGKYSSLRHDVMLNLSP